MCETATAAYHRHDISDRAWNILAPKLPGGPGKVGRPAQDNRRFINAVFWVLRTGAPWRDLPPDYGHWNTACIRFQQFGLDAFLTSTAEPAMHSAAFAVVRGQVRQGAPVRSTQNTALLKRRLSCAGRPTLPGPPGSSGARVFQARSDMSWR